MPKMTAGNQMGFTLVEIIAVLVILGVLAAFGVVKYVNMADETRIHLAQGAIAEIQGRLASAQAKYLMSSGGIAPNSAQLYTYATGANAYGNAANLANVGADFTVTTNGAGAPINIVVSAVQGASLTTNQLGTFRAAGDP
jgi:MSHA pilin protein MshA